MRIGDKLVNFINKRRRKGKRFIYMVPQPKVMCFYNSLGLQMI